MEILRNMKTQSKSSDINVLMQRTEKFKNDLKKYFMLAVIIILVAFAVTGNAQIIKGLHPPDYQVKAVFLYKFALFVEWPQEAFADSNAPIIIGILGRDPFGDYLDRIVANKKIKGRKLIIKRFKRHQKLEPCHILYISSSERKYLNRIFKKIGDSNTLTVGEINYFTRDGGIINFVMKRNKIRFEINLTAAEKAGLKISSKLIRLAENYKEQTSK